MSIRIITSSPNSTRSSESSLQSRILNRIRNLTTCTDSFNQPTRDQYRSNDRADLRALIFHDETPQENTQQDGQQGHKDEHSRHGSNADCCQEVVPVSLLFPEPKTFGKKNLTHGRRFFSRTLKLTLCAVVLLTVLPSGQGAPLMEPDSLVYQENFAGSKRFIVLLIVGAIWGWLTGPVLVPSPLNPAMFNHTSATSHPRSNRTTRAADEELTLPTLSFFNVFGFPFRILGYLAAKTVSGDFKLEAIPRISSAEAPHREKRCLAIFDLVSGALTHWILPEDLIKNTDELANKTTPSFTPVSVKLIQASRNVVSTKDLIQHKRNAEVPTELEKEIIENLAHIMASTPTS